jgi:hypothetical protein
VTAEPGLVERFFDDLSGHGHDPLLDRLDSTGRFEVRAAGNTDCWLVTVKGGHVTVSRSRGDADWVIRTDRATLDEVIRGDAGVLAAYLSGDLDLVLQDPSMRFGMIRRLFAGPAPVDKQSLRDERRGAGAPR